MPGLLINGITRTIDLIVFDKDGTLVDFDLLWSGKLVHGVEAVLSAAPALPHVRASLLQTLGIDPLAMRVIPESPLAVSTLAKLGTATSIVLYQNGVPWHEAERITREVFMPAIETLPQEQDIRAIGPVQGLMAKLKHRGFRLAIFTSDDRNATLATLPYLGIMHFIEDMICGDDGIPGKPSGDGLIELGRRLQVAPANILMIGDSVADMASARDAKIGCSIGVLSGTGREADLLRVADQVVADIHALEEYCVKA